MIGSMMNKLETKFNKNPNILMMISKLESTSNFTT